MRKQEIRLLKDSTPRSTATALLCLLFWLPLSLLSVRVANAQGTVRFNTRILSVGTSQTIHIWGPTPAYQWLTLVGLGSNDNPAGTTAFAGNGMKLIGDGGAAAPIATGDGRFVMGYRTTFAQLIGAVGQNMPESALVPLAGVTTFRTGSALGDVVAITSTFTNNPASVDAPWATIEIVAWDNSSGQYPTWTEAYPAWTVGNIAAGHSAAFNVANIGGTANIAPDLTSGGGADLTSFNLHFGTSTTNLFGPRILQQPQSQVGYWGKSVTFDVVADSLYPMAYQWLKGGTPLDGATASSLVLTNLQLTNAGNYSVMVANDYGSICSDNAYLTMYPAGVSSALYLGITIDGIVGFIYGIQYTTDLSNTNSWVGVANITLTLPTQIWYDSQPASQAKGYYRVVQGPISIP